MFDTQVTIVGNALHEPEWRRTASTGALVATFKIASTARRFQRDTGRWVDGNSLRVRVTCWRTLASNVAKSVTRGDPLIVTGRLYTRDWTDEKEQKRLQYEVEAFAIGHDLSRGRAVFERRRPALSTSAVEDEQEQLRAGGELTEDVPPDEVPAHFDDTSFEELERAPIEVPPAAVSGFDDPLDTIRAGGFTAEPVNDPGAPPEPEPDPESQPGEPGAAEPVPLRAPSEESDDPAELMPAARQRRRSRSAA